jgi:hypothetical protein
MMCAFARDLESMFRAAMLKILLQQYWHDLASGDVRYRAALGEHAPSTARSDL